ncbi:MAG: dienelactone hydrolase family protein, partial [Clostridia bacterium]|nr:dienelactone hydrolase family protein [Clostridia bacterium]
MVEQPKLLTPISLWSDFDNGQPLQISKISEVRYDNVVYSEMYFSGRKTAEGRVRIYGVYVTPDDGESRSAILYIPEITERMNYDSIIRYAKMGYSVLAVDLYGKRAEGDNYTVYPADIAYANYETCGRRLTHVDDSAKETSWYEWVAVCKYGLQFLRSQADIDKIGVIGVKDGAEAAWQLAATETGLACSVMMFGAGWSAYRGIPKYSEKTIVMDDERRRFIAAVDSHAYAPYAKCPVLYLTATNSETYDFDRANDTLSRVNEDIECVFNFAPAFNFYLDYYCLKDVELFIGRHFGRVKYDFASRPSVGIEQDGNYLTLDLSFGSPEKVKECKVYINEGVVEPSLRNWASCGVKDESGKDQGRISYEYVVSGNPGSVFAFGMVRYKDGSSLSTKLLCKKIEGVEPKRANLVYSSKNGLDEIAFYDKNALGKKDVFVNIDDFIQLEKGADDIFGAYSRYGLISYKFGEPCC